MSTKPLPAVEPLAAARPVSPGELVPYLLTGMFFGIVLVKSQVVSWFRIQEMFRFDAFHMYGVIFAAILTAHVSLRLLRRSGARARGGHRIALAPKHMGRGTRYWAGGSLFGLGWGLTGACPGPLVALAGAGIPVYVVALACAVAGAWTYGVLRDRLPH